MVIRLTKAPVKWGLYMFRSTLMVCAFLLSVMNAHADKNVTMFDPGEAAKIVWSTFIAIEQANDTLNYSVFREIAAPEFQRKNSAEHVAKLFAGLRQSGVDLSRVLLLNPEYEISPQIAETGLLRMRGKFAVPPEVVNFDLLYQMIYGEWRLLGVAVVTGLEEAKIERRRFWFKK